MNHDPIQVLQSRRPGLYSQLLLVLAQVGMVLWLRSFLAPVVAVDQPTLLLPLAQRIEREAMALGYDLETAQACGTMALSWRTWSQRGILEKWSQTLEDATQRFDQGDDPPECLAATQEKLASDLRAMIHRHIRADEQVYDLAEVVERHRAQCLGFTQLYYVLARALALDVVAVNVIRVSEDQPLTVGQGHVTCLVQLADGRVVMFDVPDRWACSVPFVFAEGYQRVGVTWECRDQAQGKTLFDVIQCLDRAGLQAQRFNAQGAAATRQGHWGQALAIFERAVPLDPQAVEIRNNRAGAYLQWGRLDEALADCDRCIELNPQRPGPYNTRGMCHSHAGRLDAALQDFNTALTLCPEFAKAYNNRGCLYNKTGAYDRALSDFNRALALAPHYAEAYHNRANTYVRLGDYQEAIASYNAAVRCCPQQHQVYLGRGLAYALAGKDQRACRDLQQALSLRPDNRPKVARIVNRFGLDLPLAQATTQMRPRATGPGSP